MSRLVESPIDAGALLKEVEDVECGGTVLFFGSVRRGEDDGPVASIDYSAYREMADEEFERVLDDARERWPQARFSARHRLGIVPLGEPSIAVAASAPHRNEAFAAARFVIDEAKRRLPIWKKELFEDGSVRWREGRGERPQSVPPSS